MSALTGLWNSEKGLLGLALIVASTVLCALGAVTSEQWLYFTGAIYGVYTTGKTVQGAFASKVEPAPVATTMVTATTSTPVPPAPDPQPLKVA